MKENAITVSSLTKLTPYRDKRFFKCGGDQSRFRINKLYGSSKLSGIGLGRIFDMVLAEILFARIWHKKVRLRLVAQQQLAPRVLIAS